MIIELDKSIREYISIIRNRISQLGVSQTGKIIHIVPSKKGLLLEAVESLERLPIFNELVNITKATYKSTPHRGFPLSFREAIKNFFRRSRIYLSYFEKSEIDVNSICTSFHKTFQANEAFVRHLIPLEYLEFKLREDMEFDSFALRRFSSDELHMIVDNSINEIFYPYSTYNVKKLSMWWFLDIKCTEPLLRERTIRLDFMQDFFEMRLKFTEFPESVIVPLYNLVLFDWKPGGQSYNNNSYPWQGFGVPFILELDDNLIDFPKPAPDISRLATEPVIDHITGEEIGEKLIVWFPMGKEETEELKGFLEQNLPLLNIALLKKFPFLNSALGYLTKAFFTILFSNSPEQLLWHITSIEALLGERGKGVTRRLSQRLGRILGRTQIEQQDIESRFKDLYEIRCDLVHGNPWTQRSTSHLYIARNMARQACLWFLYCLSKIEAKNGNRIRREDLLAYIDRSPNILINCRGLENLF